MLLAIVNIDNATDLESDTLAVGDKILLSDGTEGILLSQLDTLFWYIKNSYK